MHNTSNNLPWNDHRNSSFIKILITLLAVVFIFGAIIPMIKVPEPDRSELEKLPPQLAKVLERKKLEKPKPVEPPKVEKKEEPKPEPKPEHKPEPKPEPKPVPPKPEPKPAPKPKIEATPEQRQKAKETAKKAFGSDALSALRATRSQVPIAALGTSSKNLSNAGSTATNVGTVVDRDAALRGRSEERRVGKECRSRWWPDQ